MQKLIGKKVYDTEKSEIVKKVTYSFYGDPTGYEETLYKTQDGFFFLYVNGGEASKYPKESIVRMAKPKAEEWLANN